MGRAWSGDSAKSRSYCSDFCMWREAGGAPEGLCGVPSCPRLWEVPLERGAEDWAEVPRGTQGGNHSYCLPPSPNRKPSPWHVLWEPRHQRLSASLSPSVPSLGRRQPPWAVGCGPAAAIPLPTARALDSGLYPLVVQLGGRPGVSQMAAHQEIDPLSPTSSQLPHAQERPWEWVEEGPLP